MEAIGAIIFVIALAAGAMVYSSSDIDNEAKLKWCFGLCMELEHNMKSVSDPNNPDEIKREVKNEIRDDVRNAVTGR